MLFNGPYGYDEEKSFTGESKYLLLSLTQNVPDADFEIVTEGILDMTQHFRAGYGKERMTRSSELCVYGIREI